MPTSGAVREAKLHGAHVPRVVAKRHRIVLRGYQVDADNVWASLREAESVCDLREHLRRGASPYDLG